MELAGALFQTKGGHHPVPCSLGGWKTATGLLGTPRRGWVGGHHCDEQVCGGGMREKEKWSGVCGRAEALLCLPRPWWWPGPVVPLKAVRLSLVWATTWGDVDVWGPCCRRGHTNLSGMVSWEAFCILHLEAAVTVLNGFKKLLVYASCLGPFGPSFIFLLIKCCLLQ